MLLDVWKIMRNYRLDNIKILMVFFVVFGHLIEPLMLQIPVIKTVWMWIYIFHMPVFVMAAGMFSKAYYSHNFLHKQKKTILVPFFIFTVGYELFHFLLNGKASDYGVHFQPYWILWFLLSLYIWRLTLPLVLKLKFPILTTICMAILAGYIDPIGRFMGISRTLYFFPFFIFGHTVLPKVLSFVHSLNQSVFFQSRYLPRYLPRYFLWGAVLISIFITVNLQDFSHGWLLGSHAYTYIVGDVWYAGLYRLGLYILSFFLSLVIICLVPNKKLGVTAKGKNSLYVYLWHGFIVKALIAVGLIGMIGLLPVYLALSVFFLIAAGLTFILSLNLVGAKTEQYLLGPVKVYLQRNTPKAFASRPESRAKD